MTVSIFTHRPYRLASGTVVAIEEATGKVERIPADLTFDCNWIVQTPSGNPEPDSESDCWNFLPCGSPTLAIEGEGFVCAAGHEHLEYGSVRQQQAEREEALMEMMMSR